MKWTEIEPQDERIRPSCLPNIFRCMQRSPQTEVPSLFVCLPITVAWDGPFLGSGLGIAMGNYRNDSFFAQAKNKENRNLPS